MYHYDILGLGLGLGLRLGLGLGLGKVLYRCHISFMANAKP